MDSAPREKPANVSSTMVILTVPSVPQTPPIKYWKKMMKKAVSPNTANPATPKPITVPPPKDTLSAWGRLVRAACVVRTFVLVAIFIPMFPAKAEKKAPKMNATMIKIWVVGTTKEIAARTRLAMTTKIANKRYSAFRKAKAPS